MLHILCSKWNEEPQGYNFVTGRYVGGIATDQSSALNSRAGYGSITIPVQLALFCCYQLLDSPAQIPACSFPTSVIATHSV
jgi:hypothetical protein